MRPGGIGHPDLAAFRLVKGGEAGLNLRLGDLFDKEIEFPSLIEAIRTLIRGRRIRLRVKAFPNALIERLVNVQMETDVQTQKEIDKAKQKGNL